MENRPVLKRYGLFLLVLAPLAACSPKVDLRGYASQEQFKEAIQPGQTTKNEVLAHFGSPSSQSSFGTETWYYISSRKEAVGFLKPEVVKQDIVKITFDTNDTVSALETYDEHNAKEVDMAKRVTPTEGHSIGFFEQILGNIGRFNKSGDDSPIAPGRRPNGRY